MTSTFTLGLRLVLVTGRSKVSSLVVPEVMRYGIRWSGLCKWCTDDPEKRKRSIDPMRLSNRDLKQGEIECERGEPMSVSDE